MKKEHQFSHQKASRVTAACKSGCGPVGRTNTAFPFLTPLNPTHCHYKSLTDAPHPAQEDQLGWEQHLAQSALPALRAASQIDTESI